MRESTFTLVYWGFIPSFPTKGQLVSYVNFKSSDHFGSTWVVKKSWPLQAPFCEAAWLEENGSEERHVDRKQFQEHSNLERLGLLKIWMFGFEYISLYLISFNYSIWNSFMHFVGSSHRLHMIHWWSWCHHLFSNVPCDLVPFLLRSWHLLPRRTQESRPSLRCSKDLSDQNVTFEVWWCLGKLEIFPKPYVWLLEGRVFQKHENWILPGWTKVNPSIL